MNWEEYLWELDDLRYEKPREAFAKAMDAVETPTLPRDLLSLALGVAGSCLRADIDYDEAEALLREALRIAGFDLLRVGDIHQRLSMVHWNRLDFSEALKENCCAFAFFSDIPCTPKIAESLVERGIFVGSMGHFMWSNEAFSNGLGRLTKGSKRDSRYRATALCGLAHNFLELGSPDLATPYLEEARNLDLDERNAAKVEWQHGCWLVAKRDFTGACEVLGEAVQLLAQTAPIDAALAATDFAKVLIKAGAPGHARALARTMAFLMSKLPRNRAARLAVEELVMAGRRGEGLTLRLLESVRERIKQSQANCAPPGSR